MYSTGQLVELEEFAPWIEQLRVKSGLFPPSGESVLLRLMRHKLSRAAAWPRTSRYLEGSLRQRSQSQGHEVQI